MAKGYFDARPVRTPRGRGARGKNTVLALLNEMVASTQRLSLTAQRDHVPRRCRWPGELKALSTQTAGAAPMDRDLGYQKHFRVQRGNNEFANKYSHINGIKC